MNRQLFVRGFLSLAGLLLLGRLFLRGLFQIEPGERENAEHLIAVTGLDAVRHEAALLVAVIGKVYLARI